MFQLDGVVLCALKLLTLLPLSLSVVRASLHFRSFVHTFVGQRARAPNLICSADAPQTSFRASIWGGAV